MADYEDLGLDSKLRKKGSIASKPTGFTTALEYNLTQEPTPYVHRTVVSKGTVQTTLGGVIDFRDLTGGTSLITYNPATGAITLNGPIVTNGTFTFGTAGTFSGPVTFTGAIAINAQGTISNHSLVFAGGTTDGTAAIRMLNSGGTERLTMEITGGGFSQVTSDGFVLKGNTSNRIDENFGLKVTLADSGGTHALRVYNAGGTERFAMTSAGFMEIKGTQADPGGGGAGVARIFVQNNGGKDQLRVEFNTGTSVVIGAEP